MVRITRREFLKYCSVAAGALGLSASTLMKLEKAYAKEVASGGIPVIWLDGAACTGCSVSLLNSQFYVDAKDLLINTLDLNYHKTVMTACGAYHSSGTTGIANALTAAQNTYNFPIAINPLTSAVAARGGYVLVVEGAIPCATPVGGAAGDYCKVGDLTGSGDHNMLENIHKLASRALAVVAVGTCASFGGIPGARGNATDARGCLYKGTTYGAGALLDSAVGGGSITNVLGLPIEACTINVPGCPPHPDWIVGTIAHIVSTLGDLTSFLGLVQQGVNAGDLTLAQNALKAALPPVTNYYRPRDYGYREYQCNAGPCPWRYNNATNRAKATDPYTNSWSSPTFPYYTSAPSTGPYGPAGTNPPYALTDYTTEVDYNRRYPQGDSKRLGRVKFDDSIEGLALGCLGILGCKGRKTKADCSRRRWNTDTAEQYGVNWCVGSRGNCHGCTEPTFPDKAGKFYTFI